MISAHETEVTFRFDALHWRFKASVDPEDYRLRGIRNAIGPVDGMRILDLGCGKGRFARALQEQGAEVTGIDLSSAMLSEATGVDRVRGSARRLPFRSGCFDAVLAVEVFEHLEPGTWHETLSEARRVLAPRGSLAIVDKSLASWNAQRPWVPSALLKRIDERRGRWMYPADGPVRERWFWPSKLRKEMQRYFADVRIVHLLSPDEEEHMLFRKLPTTRLMALWVARADGGADV
ncbi:class I SAM-dependent methyltransferase [Paludisphaera borealis]|uniref:Phthiotriol/phenolphthiotriol dimycocerosates methyltransferase n=1 Tax=Paludisphaera borealis TaxID=1387353 RepID=A0A1U7CVL4_9BACT|nr:class I SAM-dependent methyltransferase [Paludisphaera borealis]APW62923.1 Phthiotriol/phenolphthiotriol dimycocerosates methyltransferase [Paludisphaera borealis]